MMLQQKEVLKIGEEVDSLHEIDELNMQERLKTGLNVEPLALTHADHKGRSIFPVTKDWTRVGADVQN